MAGKFTSFKDDLLLALAKAGWNNPTTYIEPKNAADNAGLIYQPGWIREAVKTLEERGLVKATYYCGSAPDGGMDVVITGSGLEAAEALEEERRAEGVGSEAALVRLDHESPVFKATKHDLKELIHAVQTNNQFASSDEEAHERIVAELESGQSLLKAHSVRLDAVMAVLVKALKWLVVKFADNVVGVLATGLLTALLTLLGVSL